MVISDTMSRSRSKALLFRISLISFHFLFFSNSSLRAQDRPKTYHTQFARIAYENENDLFTFTRNIGKGMFFQTDSLDKNPLLVKNRVDRIVEIASSLLDMRPLNLRFNIALHRTRQEIVAVYRSLGMMGTAPRSFYYHRTRTIFINIDDISDRILSHEIAHAIICAYFGLPPPARMQEILAQYVDKHLWDE